MPCLIPVSGVPCVATFPLCVVLDPRPPSFSMLSSPLPPQVAAEVRKLRQAQCAFEIVDPAQAWKEELANHQAEEEEEEEEAKKRSASGNSSGSGGGSTERAQQQQTPPPWRRALGLPSWNSCFRCLFNCGTFRNTSMVSEDRRQWHTYRPPVQRRGRETHHPAITLNDVRVTSSHRHKR